MSHWNIIKTQAIKFHQFNTEWNSFVHMRRYAIKEIHNDYLVIEKLSGGKPVKLKKIVAESAIDRLVKTGSIKKMNMLSSVACESALVRLHPSVQWNEQSKEFYWQEEVAPTLNTVRKFVDEASDDDLQKIVQLVRKRHNQARFRKNLLSVYNHKCCISGSGVPETLVAAHVLDHAVSGINQSINGLLLRADLHILFDESLLLINPYSLTVQLHPSLLDSEYHIYHGKQIAHRNDGKEPSREYLRQKWNSAGWA